MSEESKLETKKVGERRWTDHWQVKLMIAVLGFVAVTTASGGTWIVARVVGNESKNTEQDYRIKAMEDTLGGITHKLDKIDDKLDEMRKTK
jgi:peptidoglycan hydrolase CwlO-like protein